MENNFFQMMYLLMPINYLPIWYNYIFDYNIQPIKAPIYIYIYITDSFTYYMQTSSWNIYIFKMCTYYLVSSLLVHHKVKIEGGDWGAWVLVLMASFCVGFTEGEYTSANHLLAWKLTIIKNSVQIFEPF